MSENCGRNCDGCARTFEDRNSVPDLKAYLTLQGNGHMMELAYPAKGFGR